ncbi:MAG: hypothetical protein ACLPSH_10245 [Vulcanimicrobiaceae bacterium]
MNLSRAATVRRFTWFAFGAVAVAGMLASAFAPHPASAGLLDSVNGSFATTTAPMYATAATWSKTIFYAIAGLEFLWALAEGVLFQSNLEGWLNSFAFRLLLFGCGLWLVTNQVVVATWATAEIVTIAGSFSSAGVPLTPDGILPPRLAECHEPREHRRKQLEPAGYRLADA